MKKLNEFTPEFKEETLKTLYNLYMELNTISLLINDNYNRDVLQIEFLQVMIQNSKSNLEMCTLFLKEKHTILNCEFGKVLHFDVH